MTDAPRHSNVPPPFDCATGSGKTALIYIPLMVREGTMSVVISPTNFLQRDMVSSMQKKNIPSIAINTDTLNAASLTLPARNLWSEAKAGAHRLIFIGPEMMKSVEYHAFIADKNVRSRLAQFTVDELHVADEWGVEFRKDFQDIATMRARLPDHTTFVGLSASIEPGRQYEACVKLMGFRPGFHLEKQDCERRNVALIVRVIKHTSSGLIFLDLDFLVPPGILKASDAPKYLVFVQTIDQGHRLVNYLRSLLPLHLQKDARKLIRHHHSMACPECKAEGMESLYKCGETMSSAAAVLQRAGRPVRERGTNGVAYVYVSKANMAEAMTYLNSAAGKADKRVLHAKDPTSHIRDIIPSEETAAADSDTTPTPRNLDNLPGLAAAGEHPAISSATKKKGNVTSAVSSKPGHRTCSSLLLIFAAHARDRCIQRQINMIYDNPGVDADCGRCSSCVGDKIPCPRPRETGDSSASAVSTAAGEDGDPELDKVPGFMKPQTKDLKGIAEKLEMSARKFRWMEPMGVDALLVSSRIFLPPSVVGSITSSFLLITSKEILMERVCDWTYKDKYGDMLWEVVNPLVSELSHELITRHNITLEKQRDARLHKWIVSTGLDHIKKVQLKLPPPPPPAEDPVPQTPPPLTATIPPTIFYSPSKQSNPLKRKISRQGKGSSKRQKKSVSMLSLTMHQEKVSRS
ncbi:hypothetical protein R3P38DRAFT_3332499 [Favolaschia claudopus]|uniref:DNA 3'-5' helicase n=1 Tax=Favolaschia claudopus TaxID=2862362 RepID=A0AAV9ZMM4_9AGAR